MFRVTANKAGYDEGTADSDPVVVEALSATTHAVVSAPGGTGIGATLTSTVSAWNRADVTNSFQWLRDGSAISGATSTTYLVTIQDLGKPISLRVVGRKPGFFDAASSSNAITITAGGPLQVTLQPSITGTSAVGNVLAASSGAWSQQSAACKYQWTRNDVPIRGANASTYALTPENAGTAVGVTVVACKVGYADGSASARAVSVSKLTSTTSVALSSTRIKHGKRVKVTIAVAVPGVAGPTGTIRVMDGKKKLKTMRLSFAKNGKVTVKLKKGKHKIRAIFLGNDTTMGSRSKMTKLLASR